ncbi:MAG: hypothetical protein J6X66_05850 [Lachnospiraceae bacterium]|nr:hypothetical protein [Lachnospiraceae bacterium]
MEDDRIEAILKHLDKEVESGTVRMSVTVDEKRDPVEEVSHRGCRIYGDEANRIVGKLDMYSDSTLKDQE